MTKTIKHLTYAASALALMAGTAHAADINVGSVAGVTGPIAELVAPIVAGRNLAAEHVNAQGGLLEGDTYNLILSDSQCDPKAGVDAGGKVVNVEQVGMFRTEVGLQPGQRRDLPACRVRSAGATKGNHLDRAKVARRPIPGKPHLPEPTLSDGADQVEVGHFGRRQFVGHGVITLARFESSFLTETASYAQRGP